MIKPTQSQPQNMALFGTLWGITQTLVPLVAAIMSPCRGIQPILQVLNQLMVTLLLMVVALACRAVQLNKHVSKNISVLIQLMKRIHGSYHTNFLTYQPESADHWMDLNI